MLQGLGYASRGQRFQGEGQRHGQCGNARQTGIHKKYGACHTALIGGYAIEGHVPSREILRLLHEKPNALGLATVPGMPVGAPGMAGPAYHGLKDPYSVMLLSKDGGATQYQKYEGKKT